ncbi:MAG TPA: hypothetical protein VGC05_12750, partial [Mycobacterium sp.]
MGECRGVTGFHHWFFLDELAEALGLSFAAYAVRDGVGLVGVVPVLLKRVGPVATSNYLPVPYVGPVVVDGRLTDVIAAMRPRLARQRTVVTKWSFAAAAELDLPALHRLGYTIERHTNFYSDPAVPVEEQWSRFAPDVRANVRKAERAGVTCGPSTEAEIMTYFPRLVSAPYLRQRTPLDYPEAGAKMMAGRFIDDPRIVWRSVRKEGEFLGISALIADGGRACGWQLL